MTVRSRRRARKVLLASTLCLWAERAGEGPAWPGLFLSLLPQHFEAIEWILLNAFQQCQFSNCRGTPRVTCATGRSRFRGGSLSAPRIVVRLARGGRQFGETAKWNRVERNSSARGRTRRRRFSSEEPLLAARFPGGQETTPVVGGCEGWWGASALLTSGWDGDSEVVLPRQEVERLGNVRSWS